MHDTDGVARIRNQANELTVAQDLQTQNRKRRDLGGRLLERGDLRAGAVFRRGRSCAAAAPPRNKTARGVTRFGLPGRSPSCGEAPDFAAEALRTSVQGRQRRGNGGGVQPLSLPCAGLCVQLTPLLGADRFPTLSRQLQRRRDAVGKFGLLHGPARLAPTLTINFN